MQLNYSYIFGRVAIFCKFCALNYADIQCNKQSNNKILMVNITKNSKSKHLPILS